MNNARINLPEPDAGQRFVASWFSCRPAGQEGIKSTLPGVLRRHPGEKKYQEQMPPPEIWIKTFRSIPILALTPQTQVPIE